MTRNEPAPEPRKLLWFASAIGAIVVHAALASFLLRPDSAGIDVTGPSVIDVELSETITAPAAAMMPVAIGPEQVQSEPAAPLPATDTGSPDHIEQTGSRDTTSATPPSPALTQAAADPVIPPSLTVSDDLSPPAPVISQAWHQGEQSDDATSAPSDALASLSPPPQQLAKGATETIDSTPLPDVQPRKSARIREAWNTQVAVVLARSARRFRHSPQARREQGITRLIFVVDRQGRLVSAKLAASSGSSILDQEAMAVLQRAAPFPPPPVEVTGETITLAVPVLFGIR